MSNNGEILFGGNSSQLVAESGNAAKAIEAVGAAAEVAQQQIRASYDAMQAKLEETGASQAQLASAARQYTRIMANVTEEGAQRSINALRKFEMQMERTRTAGLALGTIPAIQQPVSQFTLGGYVGGGEASAAKAAEDAVEGLNAAHERGVSSAIMFGSEMRTLEGNFTRNVRAAEIFAGSIEALQPLIRFAFPIVGVATLGYAFIEMGEHAWDAYQNIVNLRAAIEGLDKLDIAVANKVRANQDAAEGSVAARAVVHHSISGMPISHKSHSTLATIFIRKSSPASKTMQKRITRRSTSPSLPPIFRAVSSRSVLRWRVCMMLFQGLKIPLARSSRMSAAMAPEQTRIRSSIIGSG